MSRRQIELLPKDTVLDLTKKPKDSTSHWKGESSIEKRYEQLKVKRNPFLERAREYSKYTIPNLYPIAAESNQGDGVSTTGWQSFGASAVNHLTNKIVMTLFPPHNSFARLELTQRARSQLRAGDEDIINAQGGLILAEKEALLEHERVAGRVALGEGVEHLIVSGNTCIYMPSGNSANLINYPLDRYVARRDKSGNLLELIVQEIKAIDTFDKEVQDIIRAKRKEVKNDKFKRRDDDNVSLYTRSILRGGKYIITQEVLGELIGEKAEVTLDEFPFIVLRWRSNFGEDYGRGLVELHAGDFHMVQLLSEALGKGMILMSDIKYLVRAGSVTDVDHLINSPTGEFVYGNIEDIGVLQLQKYADFTPIANTLDKYERRLGQAFMMQSQVQRNAERVTAYEIRRDAVEMEQSLGGAYSLFSNTLQRPYFRLLLNRIGFNLPSSLVDTVLMTGIEALSKMGEADKLMQFTEMLQLPAQWAQPVQQRMKWSEYAQHVANQLSLDMPYLMTEEEFNKVQAQQQQAQQQQMMMQAAADSAPQVLGQVVKQQKPKGD